jgi:hypothetical protein
LGARVIYGQYIIGNKDMKKPNLKRKKQVLALLAQGITPKEVILSLSISQAIFMRVATWLIDYGYLRRVSRGAYRPTGKPWPKPQSGQVELIGQAGDMLIIARPHPIDRYATDYLGALLKEDHLEIITEGLGTLLKIMVRYPTAVLLTACTLANLKAAVVGVG